MSTLLANPTRTDMGALGRQALSFFANPFSRLLMDAAGGYLLILNAQNQILAANRELLEALGKEEGDELLGLRPGEVFSCVHAQESPLGCGKTSHCAFCGSFQAIASAREDLQPKDGECRILMRRDGKLDAAEFQVRVTPLEYGGDSFLAVVLLDISGQKRKEAFERLFIHDLANSIQCLEGWSERLESGIRDPGRASAAMVGLIQRLTSQVKHHRILMQAERGELELKFYPVDASAILDTLRQQFQQHELARQRVLEIQVPQQDEILVTDRELLLRVLTNMVVNALEATRRGDTVTVWHKSEEGRPGFHVQNPGMIPQDVAEQIFHRSFSTKGGYGRGLGTYGMKLLGEDHLGGTLSLQSTETEGTRFSIILPSTPPSALRKALR